MRIYGPEILGDVTSSGDLVPLSNNTYDLGSPTKQWRDLYLSSASLYIDGQKVISSNADTLTFTTDTGQSIKLLETGADDIILQTDTGNVELKGTVEIQSGKKIIDSAGTVIQFGDTLGVTGSIQVSGTVDGIDLQAFSSSVASSVASSTADYNELTNVPSGIISSSAQLANTTIPGNLTLTGNIIAQEFHTEYVSSSVIFESGSTQFGDTLDDTHIFTGSLNLTGSLNVNGAEVGTGKLDETTFNSYTSSIDTRLGTIEGKTLVSSSAQTIDHLSGTGIVSGSVTIATETLYSQSFTSATAVTASHNFGTKEVIVYTYDNNDNLFFPTNIKTATTNDVYVEFNTSRSGRVVVSKGGHLVSGSNEDRSYSLLTATTATTASIYEMVLISSSANIALPSSPSAGDWVKFSNRSAATASLNPDGNKIMGETGSFTIDNANAGFEVVYTDATHGWVLVGVQGTTI
jgi:hypothetical protein